MGQCTTVAYLFLSFEKSSQTVIEYFALEYPDSRGNCKRALLAY